MNVCLNNEFNLLDHVGEVAKTNDGGDAPGGQYLFDLNSQRNKNDSRVALKEFQVSICYLCAEVTDVVVSTFQQRTLILEVRAAFLSALES